jgi:hypothetical protein
VVLMGVDDSYKPLDGVRATLAARAGLRNRRLAETHEVGIVSHHLADGQLPGGQHRAARLGARMRQRYE